MYGSFQYGTNNILDMKSISHANLAELEIKTQFKTAVLLDPLDGFNF